MKTKVIFASMLLALSAGFASANDIYVNAGSITTDTSHPYGHLFAHDVGTFSDTIDFTIPTGSLGTNANPLYLTMGGVDVYNIANLTYSVYSGTVASGGTLWGTFLGNNTSQDLAITAGGAYHILVTGDATGTSGGAYSVSLVSGVPEPETYAMMLGGIGLLGAMVRRRKNRA